MEEENGYEDCERRVYREGSTRPVKNKGDVQNRCKKRTVMKIVRGECTEKGVHVL